MTRDVTVVTGSRAEWGLLRPVARAIANHPGLSLRLVVAGSHLVSGTDADVDLPIDARVPMQEPGQTGRLADARAMGRGVIGFAEVFAASATSVLASPAAPDFVVVLGDRIEAFAAASAASLVGVRVAHLHGGDRAEGVADEAMRHAITKLSHLHLAATEESAQRVRRLGEPEAAVFCVGSPAIDGLCGIEPLAGGPAVVVLQHPVGRSDAEERRRMELTLAATDDLAREGGRVVLCPNLDAGREGVLAAIRARVPPAEVVAHLPRERFVAMLRGARVLVGNSSAGLIEAAACGCAAVDVGPRQGGREKPAHAVHAEHDEEDLRFAIAAALAFDFAGFAHPYGDGHTGERVAALLAERPLAEVPLAKRNTF